MFGAPGHETNMGIQHALLERILGQPRVPDGGLQHCLQTGQPETAPCFGELSFNLGVSQLRYFLHSAWVDSLISAHRRAPPWTDPIRRFGVGSR